MKARIDAMTQEEMAYHWRFAPTGDSIFRSLEAGEYFYQRFMELGGMTFEISRKIGWD